MRITSLVAVVCTTIAIFTSCKDPMYGDFNGTPEQFYSEKLKQALSKYSVVYYAETDASGLLVSYRENNMEHNDIQHNAPYWVHGFNAIQGSSLNFSVGSRFLMDERRSKTIVKIYVNGKLVSEKGKEGRDNNFIISDTVWFR